MNVLIACEFSGTVREAFVQKGHNAISCDLLPSEGSHIRGNVIPLLDFCFDLMIAHPPCTDLCASGARWFEEKIADGRQKRAIDFFMKFADCDIPKICIENPIGIMSTIYRKPNQIIQPWMFGHGETKATCLWLKNLPNLVPTNIVPGREQRVHKMGQSTDRGKKRSITYQGIARAMAEQWG